MKEFDILNNGFCPFCKNFLVDKKNKIGRQCKNGCITIWYGTTPAWIPNIDHYYSSFFITLNKKLYLKYFSSSKIKNLNNGAHFNCFNIFQFEDMYSIPDTDTILKTTIPLFNIFEYKLEDLKRKINEYLAFV